jgi:hypothetical protein
VLTGRSPLAEEDAATAGLLGEQQLRQHFIGEVRAGRLKLTPAEMQKRIAALVGLREMHSNIADLRARLLKPKVGKWGQLQEWMIDRDGENDTHRHTSQLFAVYPGRQISVTKTPELAKAAFSLKEGEVSEPVKSQLGWHVFVLKKVYPANVPSFDKIKELRDMYVSLYQKRFYEIGKYYDAASSHRLESIKEKAYHDVISSTQALFEEIASGSEGQKKFEARINADLDDIVSKIRSDFPKLKDDDIRFICYLIVGFDTSTISFLMDISKENVRVKKHRLREKLNGYSGPNETLYRLFA